MNFVTLEQLLSIERQHDKLVARLAQIHRPLTEVERHLLELSSRVLDKAKKGYATLQLALANRRALEDVQEAEDRRARFAEEEARHDLDMTPD